MNAYKINELSSVNTINKIHVLTELSSFILYAFIYIEYTYECIQNK